jgi:oxygen-dependent protoporphyrinogen oxidase
LAGIDAELSADLAEIEYASTAVISLAYHIRQIVHPLDGFGFVVPAIERRKILSASFSSQKFPGRAPNNHALLRVFIGGATQAELLNLDDAELIRIAIDEIADLLGVSGQPVLSTIARWSQAMPQYHLGHLTRVAKIESRLAGIGGLALAGNAYRGVGIPQVVASGQRAAEQAVESAKAQRPEVCPKNTSPKR